MADLNLEDLQGILNEQGVEPLNLETSEQVPSKLSAPSGELSYDDLSQVIAQQPLQQLREDDSQSPGFLANVRDFITGESKTTSRIEEVPEIGMAPELNEFSMRSLKTSAGLLATGDTEKAKQIIKAQIPEASFGQDEKGNVIVDLPSGAYALNKPGLSGQDIARGIFQFAAFTPAARLATAPAGAGRAAQALTSTGLRRGVTAGVGAAGTEAALQAGAQQVGAEGIEAEEVALAGAFGAGGQVLGDIVSAGVRGVKGQIGAREQQILEAGKKFDVPVMTTDVIPPKGIVGGLARQLGERIPIFGTGGKRAIQSEAREKAVKEFTDLIPENTSAEIIASLKAQTSKVKQAAGNRLNAVRDQLEPIGNVPTSNFANKIDDALEKLSKSKLERDEATIAKLSEYREGVGQDFSFEELRNARTNIRDVAESVDPVTRSQLRSQSKAQMDQVVQSITKDLDQFARDNLSPSQFRKYKEADFIYMKESQKLQKSRLKNILDKGELTPETVENMIFSRKPSEVKMLHDSLNAEGKAAARASLIQRALTKATDGDFINPSKFAKTLDDMELNTNIFFKGKDKQALKGLKRLLMASKRAQEAGVVTPTGQSLFGIGAVGAGSQVGFWETLAAAGTSGAAARVYESPPVRNFLLRLANTPINSTGFDRLVRTSTPKITAAMQAIRQEEDN